MLASTATHFSIDVIAMCFLLLLPSVAVLLPVPSFVLLAASHRTRPISPLADAAAERALSGNRRVADPARPLCRRNHRGLALVGCLLASIVTALLLLLLTLLYQHTTVIEQRKLVKLIDSNLAALHLIALVITCSVISYKRNC